MDDDIDLALQLVEWVEDNKFRWELCYRASDDGWGSGDFHRKCDNVGPTVTLVKCGTNIFGGFTDQNWRAGARYERSDCSFLFSLRNKDNLLPFKCLIKKEQKDSAIDRDLWFGACFGVNDLHIGNNANRNKESFSNLGTTYQPPPGYEPGTPQTRVLLAGSHQLTPSEIEVFRS